MNELCRSNINEKAGYYNALQPVHLMHVKERWIILTDKNPSRAFETRRCNPVVGLREFHQEFLLGDKNVHGKEAAGRGSAGHSVGGRRL
jgi:hypothetical protein